MRCVWIFLWYRMSRVSAAQLETCNQQRGCFTFSVTPVDSPSVQCGGECAWRVCLATRGDCVGAETQSEERICRPSAGTCNPQSTKWKSYKLHLDGSVVLCQEGRPGSVLPFVVQGVDRQACDPLTGGSVELAEGASASCAPAGAGKGLCLTRHESRACRWDVKLPDSCPKTPDEIGDGGSMPSNVHDADDLDFRRIQGGVRLHLDESMQLKSMLTLRYMGCVLLAAVGIFAIARHNCRKPPGHVLEAADETQDMLYAGN